MPERALLRERFSGILDAARSAAQEYDRLAEAEQDPATRQQLERLARNQHRHVELTERLLEIVNE